MTLDEKLAKEMAGIGILATALDGYNDASISERAQILDQTATVIGGRDHYLDAYKELEVSDSAYASKTSQAINARANDIKEKYEANRSNVIAEVEGALNSILEKAKNEPEAIKKIADAFRALFKIDLPTQARADAIKASELSNILRMPIMTQVKGDPKEAQDILYRTAIAEYVITEGNNYRVDSKKLSNLMSDPVAGSILYANTKTKGKTKGK